jgi:hypothetical protein
LDVHCVGRDGVRLRPGFGGFDALLVHGAFESVSVAKSVAVAVGDGGWQYIIGA